MVYIVAAFYLYIYTSGTVAVVPMADGELCEKSAKQLAPQVGRAYCIKSGFTATGK